jgi:hypothetical protein
MKLPLVIGTTLFLLQAAPCLAQDVFNNNTAGGVGSTSRFPDNHYSAVGQNWCETVVTAYLNSWCPQYNEAIVRPAGVRPGIVRPKGWSGIGNRGTAQSAQPIPIPRSNGYTGLSDEQTQQLQARNRMINNRPDVQFFNSMAPSTGVPKYEAAPLNSNVKGRGGFGQWRNQAQARRDGR